VDHPTLKKPKTGRQDIFQNSVDEIFFRTLRSTSDVKMKEIEMSTFFIGSFSLKMGLLKGFDSIRKASSFLASIKWCLRTTILGTCLRFRARMGLVVVLQSCQLNVTEWVHNGCLTGQGKCVFLMNR
jgi:hypothetical protein